MIGTPSIQTPVSVVNGGTGAATKLAALDNLGSVFRYKSADQTVVNSTANTPDDSLYFSVVAGEEWSFEIDVFAVVESTSPGIFLAIISTGTVSYYRDYVEYNANGGPAPATTGQHTEATANIDRIVFSYPGVGTDPIFVQILGSFSVLTSGVVGLYFGQAVSSSDDTTIRKGSRLIAFRKN